MYILIYKCTQQQSKSNAVFNIIRGQHGVFKHACPRLMFSSLQILVLQMTLYICFVKEQLVCLEKQWIMLHMCTLMHNTLKQGCCRTQNVNRYSSTHIIISAIKQQSIKQSIVGTSLSGFSTSS